MNCSRRTFQLAQYAVRRYSSAPSTVKEVTHKKFQQLKKNQERFQLDDDVPVHLKAGARDKILYGATLLLTTVGLGMTLDTWYKLILK